MFDFKENYRMSNEVVEIIPLELVHLENLYKESNNRLIWEHFTENGFGRDNFENYFSRALEKRKKSLEFPFAIKDLRSNEIAGMTRIYNVDNELKNLKIGHTWIGRKFQGSGLNKNVKYLLFEFVFEKLCFERIGFGASALNKLSIRAMESVGCTQEGVLRSFLPVENSDMRIDIVLLSILKKEWDAIVKNELAKKIEVYKY